MADTLTTGYLLSKKEQRLGSPEKPLSGLGALGYKNYWTLAVMRYLATVPDEIVRLEGPYNATILFDWNADPHIDISTATSMTIEDVHSTLTQQNMISTRDATPPPPARPSPGQSIKFPKGRKNGIARRHLQRPQVKDDESMKSPFSPPKLYQITWDREKVDQYLAAWENKGYLKLKPEKLKWSPFLLVRSRADEPQATSSTPVTGTVSDQPTNADSISSPGDMSNYLPSLFVDDESSPTALDALIQAATKESHKDKSSSSRTSRSTSKVSRLEGDIAPERAGNHASKRKNRSQSGSVLSSRLKATSPDATLEPPDRPSRTRSRSMRIMENLGDPDAALIPEEGRWSRSSRAGSEAGSSRKGVRPSTPNQRIYSPRKRRRVESPPEGDVSPVLLENPVNGKHGDTPTPVHKRKVPRLTKDTESDQGAALLTPMCPSNVEEDPAKATPVRVDEVTENHNARDSSLDVKSEDLGTPLTSLTSRQSCTNDDGVSPEVNGVSVLPGGYEKEAGDVRPDQAAKEVGTLALENYGDDEDADADGEYDEDAEGEPDPELLEHTNLNIAGNL